MSRRMVLAVLCVTATACGGSSGSGGNAAVSKEFNYGSATDSASAASVGQSSLTSLLALQNTPNADNAMGATTFMNATSDLLGSPIEGIALAGTSGSAQQRALTRARSAVLSVSDFEGVQFDDSCVVATSTSVTLNNCTVTINETDSGTTVNGTITANGSVTLTNSNQTLTWGVTVAANVNVSGSGGSASVGLNYHAAGTLTAIAPAGSAAGTIDGDMTAELGVHASGNGQSLSIGVHEALVLTGVTYQTTPTSCVTGGTLEAKRVWTDWNVPNQTRPTDKAALVTFTGCNTATVQLSI